MGEGRRTDATAQPHVRPDDTPVERLPDLPIVDLGRPELARQGRERGHRLIDRPVVDRPRRLNDEQRIGIPEKGRHPRVAGPAQDEQDRKPDRAILVRPMREDRLTIADPVQGEDGRVAQEHVAIGVLAQETDERADALAVGELSERFRGEEANPQRGIGEPFPKHRQPIRSPGLSCDARELGANLFRGRVERFIRRLERAQSRRADLTEGPERVETRKLRRLLVQRERCQGRDLAAVRQLELGAQAESLVGEREQLDQLLARVHRHLRRGDPRELGDTRVGARRGVLEHRDPAAVAQLIVERGEHPAVPGEAGGRI